MEIGKTATAQPAPQARQTDPAAHKAAREFEAMFLTQMVDEMLKEVDMGDFGGGAGADQFRFFLAEAFGKEIAAQSGTGISTSLERALVAYTDTRDRSGT